MPMNCEKAGILVTGARGFVGQRVVQYLLQNGLRIRILTRSEMPDPIGFGQQCEIWHADLADSSTLSGVADGIHTVYHLAGEVRNARLFAATNHYGTENLLAQCQKSGVRRFLYLSSAGVFGAHGQRATLTETSPVCPRNGYETSKYAGERAVLQYHDAHSMQVVVLRPTIVFGEKPNPQRDSFFAWIRAIKGGRFVQLGGDFISSFIYVGDLASACLASAQDTRTGGEVYILNEPVKLSAFVGELASALGVKEPKVLPDSISTLAESVLRVTGRFASLYNRTVYSADKLAGLGFELPFGYREGLRHTIQWYTAKGLL